MFAIPLTLFGGWFYFGSQLIGSGVHVDPMPGWGMLMAGAALFVMFFGYSLVRHEKEARVLAGVIVVVLFLGMLSLVYALLISAFRMMHRMEPPGPGNSELQGMLFLIAYGLFSVGGIAVFNNWVRKTKADVLR